MNKNNLKKFLLVFITSVLGVMSFGLRAHPEIDGKLIPQVGLLFAGLFIILGRRKESAEPMLAV